MERGRVRLTDRPAQVGRRDARGEQEGAVGADEGVAYGLDRGSLGCARGGRVGKVVLGREMDDGFGRLGASTDAREIAQGTPADASPPCPDGRGGPRGPGEPG